MALVHLYAAASLNRPLAACAAASNADLSKPKKISVRQQLQGHYGKIYALHWSRQVSLYDVDNNPCSLVR
jgi:hypothetical protein